MKDLSTRGWSRAARPLLVPLVGASLALILAFAGTLSAGAVTSSSPTLPSPTGDLVAPVFPATTTLAAAARWLNLAISARERELARLTNDTAASTAVSLSGDSSFVSVVEHAESGIEASQLEIPSLTSLAGAQILATTVVAQYRVYSIVQPQVTDGISLGLLQVRTTREQASVARLLAAVTTVTEQGIGRGHARALLANATSTLTTLSTRLSTDLAADIALTPASYPATSSFTAMTNTVVAGRLALDRVDVELTTVVSLVARGEVRGGHLKSSHVVLTLAQLRSLL